MKNSIKDLSKLLSSSRQRPRDKAKTSGGVPGVESGPAAVEQPKERAISQPKGRAMPSSPKEWRDRLMLLLRIAQSDTLRLRRLCDDVVYAEELKAADDEVVITLLQLRGVAKDAHRDVLRLIDRHHRGGADDA